MHQNRPELKFALLSDNALSKRNVPQYHKCAKRCTGSSSHRPTDWVTGRTRAGTPVRRRENSGRVSLCLSLARAVSPLSMRWAPAAAPSQPPVNVNSHEMAQRVTRSQGTHRVRRCYDGGLRRSPSGRRDHASQRSSPAHAGNFGNRTPLTALGHPNSGCRTCGTDGAFTSISWCKAAH